MESDWNAAGGDMECEKVLRTRLVAWSSIASQIYMFPIFENLDFRESIVVVVDCLFGGISCDVMDQFSC